MKEDRRYSGMQNQASELIEQAFNRGFKAGLEEAKKKNKEEEEKFHVGDLISFMCNSTYPIYTYPIYYGIVVRIDTLYDKGKALKVLLSDGNTISMLPTANGLKRVTGTAFPCIEECLNFLKAKEDIEN